MIIKVILVLLSGVLGITIGIILKNNQNKKVLYFSDLYAFCDYFKHDLSFKQTKLKLLIQSFDYKSENFKDDIFNFSESFKLDNNLSTFLSKNEKEEVSKFFNSLGKVDIQTQLSLIEENKYNFEKKYNEYKEKFEKESKLYVKLGFLFGLSVGVLLL